MSSWGNAQAQQQVQQAQAGLIGQQTQAAAMQNQVMRMRMPVIAAALENFSGQQGGPGNNADMSGVPNPGVLGGSLTPSSDDLGDSAFLSHANLDTAMRQHFWVNQASTPQEINSERPFR